MKGHIRNFSTSSLPFFTALLPGLIAIPFYIASLGETQVGVYYLYMSIVGIGGTFDLGIGQTLVKYVAEFNDSTKTGLKYALESAASLLTLSTMVIIVVTAVIILITSLDWSLVFVFGLGTIVSLWYHSSLSIMRGYENFPLVAKIEAINKIGFSLLGLGMAFLFNSIIYVIAIHIIIQTALVLLYREIWNMNLSNYKLHYSFYRSQLWRHSKWVFVQNALGFLNNNVDKYLVASLVNLSSLTVYNTAKNFANLFPSFMSKGMGFLLPYFSRMRDKSEIHDDYVRFSYIINGGLAFVLILGVVIFPMAINYYLPNSADLSESISDAFPFLFISSIFLATSLLSYNVFNAIGEVRTNTIIPFLGNLCSIICLFVGGFFYGFWGVVYARLFNVVSSTIVRTITYNQVFGKNDYWFGVKVGGPLIVVVLVLLYLNIYG